MGIFSFRARKKLDSPIHLFPGDSIVLTTHDASDNTTTVHLSDPITEICIIDEVASIEAVVDGRLARGGLFIEQEKK